MSTDIGKTQLADKNGNLIDSTHPLYAQLVTGTAIAATVKLENPAGTALIGDITNPVVVAGSITPSDAFANPTTTAVTSIALMFGWNGTTWDRLSSKGTNADADAVLTKGALATDAYLKGFNGTTWDRVRAIADNATNPALGKLPVIPARANAAVPTWTEGAAVPLSSDLAGRLRVSSTISNSSSTKYVSTTTTTAYVNNAFGFTSTFITISNDSANTIQFSFDNGVTLHGDLKTGEAMTFENKAETQLALKSTAGSDAFRFWAW